MSVEPEEQQAKDKKDANLGGDEQPDEQDILYGLEIDTMNGNGNRSSLETPIFWSGEDVDLSNFGLDDSYTLVLVDSGAFGHVCPMNFGTGFRR